MKSTIIRFLLLSFILFSPITSHATAMGNIEFIDTDGKSHFLYDYKGKRILVHLWATWCAPCVEELPTLSQLINDIKDENIIILPISVNGEFDSNEMIQNFLDRYKLDNIPIYRTPLKHTYLQDLGIAEPILPFSVLIDEKGNKLKDFPGTYYWDNMSLQQYILRMQNPPSEKQ